MPTSTINARRSFLRRILAAGGLAAVAPQSAAPQSRGAGAGDLPFLPGYTRAHNYKSLKQSSYDRTGGNRDYWTIPAGGVRHDGALILADEAAAEIVQQNRPHRAPLAWSRY